MARLSAQLTTTPLPMPRSVSVGVLVIDAVAIIVIAAVISANIRYWIELEPPGPYNTRMLVGSTSALWQWPKCAHFAGQWVLLVAL